MYNGPGRVCMASSSDDQERTEALRRDGDGRGDGERPEKIFGPEPTWRSTDIAEAVAKLQFFVVRIVCMDEDLERSNETVTRPVGSGFLLPGNYLLTCNHVLPDPATCGRAFVEFDYRVTMTGAHSTRQRFFLQPEAFFATSPEEEDDWTVVRINGDPQGHYGGALPLEEEGARLAPNDELLFIHHPDGERARWQVGKAREVTEDRLTHDLDTLGGSSGAPFLQIKGGRWRVVAIHRGAEKDGNRGIRARVVRDALAARGYHQERAVTGAWPSQTTHVPPLPLEVTPARFISAPDIAIPERPTVPLAIVPAAPPPSPTTAMPGPPPPEPPPRQRLWRRYLRLGLSLSISVAAPACGLVAYHAVKESRAQQQAQALNRLRENCSVPDLRSCAELFKSREPLCLDHSAERQARAEACRDVGFLFEQGRAPREPSKPGTALEDALDYYERACRLELALGCLHAGNLYVRGVAREGNMRQAFEHFKKACDRQVPAACINLGRFYIDGVKEAGFEVKPSAEQARALLPPCNESDRSVLSCNELGRLADARGDHTLALRLYKRACEGLDARGCVNLGISYQERGHYAEAAKGFLTACEQLRDDLGCTALGLLYQSRRVPVAPGGADAKELLRRGCAANLAEACRALARELGATERAAELLRQQCRRPDADACLDLAHRLYEGRGVDKDLSEALRLARPSCDRGDARACFLSGVILLDKNELADAPSPLGRACAVGLWGACVRLGEGLERQAPPAGAEARAAYSRACEGGEPSGCYAAARLSAANKREQRLLAQRARALYTALGDAASLYGLALLADSGFEGARNRREAQRLRADACQRGYAEACGKPRR